VALALGLAGAFSAPALLLAAGALAALGRWRGAGWCWRPLIPIAVPAVLLLPVALAPPFFYDALVYHLALPWQALLEGRIAAHPENVFAAFPPLAQLIYAGPLAAGLDRVPALLHLGSFVAAGAAVAALARRLGAAAPLAAAAGAILPLIPAVVLVPGLPAAEGWAVSAVVAALALVVGPQGGKRARDRAVAPLAGFLAGSACAARLQGIPWAAIVLLILLARPAGGRVPGPRAGARLRRAGAALAGALLGSAPWWLKNLLLLRDPLAPLGWQREGMETLWGAARTQMHLAHGAGDLLRAMGTVLLPHLGYVLPLALAAILALLRDGRRDSWWLGGAVLAGALSWGATGTLERFLAPTLALLLALAAAAGRTRFGAWAASLVLAVAAAFGCFSTLRELGRWGGPGLALDREPAVLDRMVVNNPLPAFGAAGELPAGSKVLFVGEARGYSFPHRFVAPSQHDVSPLREPIEKLPAANDVRDWLVAQGYTHLLVNRAELARLAGNYPVVPWTTPAGRARFQELLDRLGAPVVKAGETAVFRL
jgi:hypothetical protein